MAFLMFTKLILLYTRKLQLNKNFVYGKGSSVAT